MNIPKTLSDFESYSSSTISELISYFPKIKLFSTYLGSESVEIFEPSFPFYERAAMINGRPTKISFYRYYISDDLDGRTPDNMKKYKTTEYLLSIQNDFNQEY